MQSQDYATAAQDVLRFIVANPSDLVVEEAREETEVTLTISAHKDDFGTIVGKKGSNIKALRQLLLVRAVRDGVKLTIDLDDGRNEE